jgi:hypothetical protein
MVADRFAVSEIDRNRGIRLHSPLATRRVQPKYPDFKIGRAGTTEKTGEEIETGDRSWKNRAGRDGINRAYTTKVIVANRAGGRLDFALQASNPVLDAEQLHRALKLFLSPYLLEAQYETRP